MKRTVHFVACQFSLIWNIFWIYVPGYKGMHILSPETTLRLCINLARFDKSGL